MTAKRLMPTVGAAGIKREVQDFARSSFVLFSSQSSADNQAPAVEKSQNDDDWSLICCWRNNDDEIARKAALRSAVRASSAHDQDLRTEMVGRFE